MNRRVSLVVLAVLGLGAFLAGLELMVTAVALPAIVVDLADWTALRHASWIVNAYLLVSVVTMPLAGRLADRWGTRRLFLAALALFTVGSALSGRAGSLDELIAGRVVQAVGGGILIPVATAAASHRFAEGHRPQALGVIGALTFLGMAAGPFVGAWILDGVHPAVALDAAGIGEGALRSALEPAWRYVFYLNVPFGVAALAITWAATEGWEAPSGSGRPDVAGAVFFSLGLVLLLVGLTLAGSASIAGAAVDPAVVVVALVLGGIVAIALALTRGRRHPEAFADPRWFRSVEFSSAALVSLLTGYAFATAIIGGAVFVDRVLYGGPDAQRVALGTLAAATALGALASGLVMRVTGLRVLTVIGLVCSAIALVRMAAWVPTTPLAEVAAWLGLFGLGFGLTVTPRSTAAVEALGRAAFGIASATVTVARMIGMAIGLAVLTAFGSTTIDRLWRQINATPDAYKAFIPVALRDRPLRDGLVVQALEDWASGEAARILVGVFLVAAAVSLVAILPAVALSRRRILAPGGAGESGGGSARRDREGRIDDERDAAIAL